LTDDDRIRIREAAGDDAGTVHAMIAKMAASTPSHISLRSTADDFTRAMTARPPRMHALLAERGETPVGVLVFFTTFSTWYGTPGVYVQDIFVDSGARGNGVGHRLLAAACQWGIQRGADHLRLSVDRENRSAQAFYDRHEMTRKASEIIYQLEGEAFRRLGGKR